MTESLLSTLHIVHAESQFSPYHLQRRVALFTLLQKTLHHHCWRRVNGPLPVFYSAESRFLYYYKGESLLIARSTFEEFQIVPSAFKETIKQNIIHAYMYVQYYLVKYFKNFKGKISSGQMFGIKSTPCC
jgi:hypothetical protein